MTLHTLSSGSQGNCLLLSDGDTHILVDAGISTRRIKAGLAQLELSMDELDGILITHEHTDHISGLATLIKHHSIPLYASPGTARQLAYRLAGVEPLLRPREPGCQFEVGQCLVTAFETSHDAAQSMDYRIDGSGSVGILTDTGYVTDEAAQVLPGVSLLVLESNHDVEYLRSGPYPYTLKQRILGSQGHLSNDDCLLYTSNVKTQPYPGFPTDMQPQIAVVLSLAQGTSLVTEGVYGANRFKYMDELRRMGAQVQVCLLYTSYRVEQRWRCSRNCRISVGSDASPDPSCADADHCRCPVPLSADAQYRQSGDRGEVCALREGTGVVRSQDQIRVYPEKHRPTLHHHGGHERQYLYRRLFGGGKYLFHRRHGEPAL